jgi:DNA mismatch repair protein MutS2
MGVPGQSSALAVAERYGISDTLIARARELLPQEQLYQRQLLEQLETERALLAKARREAESELERQRQLNDKLQDETEGARERERERLRQEAAALTQEVLQSRALLRQAKAQLAGGPLAASVQAAERLISEAASPVTLAGTLTQAVLGVDASDGLPLELLVPGFRVRIPHLGSVGEIVSAVSKGAVRVNVGGMKMSIPVDKLRAVDAPSAPTKATRPSQATPRRTRNKSLETAPSGFVPGRTSGNTCDLRGQRVEAGLDQVGVFLDQMLRLSEPVAYILHGHGTGAMKDAVREYLGQCGHVVRWEAAAREDGGDALTLCWF